jgi:hypothetical protein
MADNNAPPPDVQRAAAIVDDWLKNRPPIVDTAKAPAQPGVPNGTPQPRAETAAQKFARLHTARPDSPPVMPPWDANRKD